MGHFGLFFVILACSLYMTSSQATGPTESTSDGMTGSLSSTGRDTPDDSSLATSAAESGTPTMMPMGDTTTTQGGDGDDMSTMTTSGTSEEGRDHTRANGPESDGSTHTPTTPGGEPGRPGDDVNSDRQPVEPPSWTQCLNEVTSDDESGADIVGVFKTWCGNYEAIIECLARDLPDSAFTNPFDFFIYLNFDPVELFNRSQQLCSQLEAVDNQLSCAITQNETVAAACGNGFSGGLFHIFDIFNHREVPRGILEEIACDVTTQTTFCLRQALPDCQDDVVLPILNYYALFTNDSCIANPGEDFSQTALPPKQPETVVAKCTNEAAQTLTPDQAAAQPASLVDFVILNLKLDCKTYEPRYECYSRELGDGSDITNFLDYWLFLTFDYKNAVRSQETYCAHIEESIIPNLNDECFNQSQPALAQCEAGFTEELKTIRQDLLENGDFDRIQLQTIACKTSAARAVCFGKAMSHCGDDVAKAMSDSEMGTLPDDCGPLLARLNRPAAGDHDPEGERHEEGNYQADDSLSYGIQTGPTRSHRGQDREGIRESKTENGDSDERKAEHGHNDSSTVDNVGGMDENNHTEENKNGDSSSSKDQARMDDDEGGASDVRANLVTLSLVLTLAFFVLKL